MAPPPCSTRCAALSLPPPRAPAAGCSLSARARPQGKPVGTPDAGAFARVIAQASARSAAVTPSRAASAQHKVKGFFTAPTALRAIRKADPEARALRAFVPTLFSSSPRGARLHACGAARRARAARMCTRTRRPRCCGSTTSPPCRRSSWPASAPTRTRTNGAPRAAPTHAGTPARRAQQHFGVPVVDNYWQTESGLPRPWHCLQLWPRLAGTHQVCGRVAHRRHVPGAPRPSPHRQDAAVPRACDVLCACAVAVVVTVPWRARRYCRLWRAQGERAPFLRALHAWCAAASRWRGTTCASLTPSSVSAPPRALPPLALRMLPGCAVRRLVCAQTTSCLPARWASWWSSCPCLPAP